MHGLGTVVHQALMVRVEPRKCEQLPTPQNATAVRLYAEAHPLRLDILLSVYVHGPFPSLRRWEPAVGEHACANRWIAHPLRR